MEQFIKISPTYLASIADTLEAGVTVPAFRTQLWNGTRGISGDLSAVMKIRRCPRTIQQALLSRNRNGITLLSIAIYPPLYSMLVVDSRGRLRIDSRVPIVKSHSED